MVDERTGLELRNIEELSPPQIYIYILLNSAGKVKVGKTTNIQQRINSLSGSNGQGNEIIKCWLSPATYLHTIERIMHMKMDSFRIKNTEWFYAEIDPTGERLYSSAIHVLSRLINSKDFERCNEVRRKYEEKDND